MTTIKIDEKVWEEFKRTVNSRYGVSRNQSKIVEEAINSYNVVETLPISAKELGVVVAEYPSISEVEAHGGSIAVESKRARIPLALWNHGGEASRPRRDRAGTDSGEEQRRWIFHQVLVAR